ncbi:hypothetical protein HanPI659440_Chr11g0421931 [Helianthus annuus]|nr:hypothetical protein HanPI659440_Chr11g0421931 [Helianthus annuus]
MTSPNHSITSALSSRDSVITGSAIVVRCLFLMDTMYSPFSSSNQKFIKREHPNLTNAKLVGIHSCLSGTGLRM